MPFYAVADDLSGAAEAAAVLAGLTNAPARHPSSASSYPNALVQLLGDEPFKLHPVRPHNGNQAGPCAGGVSSVHVFDSNNRRMTAAAAGRRMAAVLRRLPNTGTIFLKFDSLLRGNIGTELQAALAYRPVVFTPAVPVNNRTVRGGTVYVHGAPLHSTSLWDAEPAPPAADIATQLAPAEAASLDLSTVRRSGLEKAVLAAADAGQVAVCDAETTEDLRCIAAAVLRTQSIAAGAAGLAGALTQELAGTTSDADGPTAAIPVSERAVHRPPGQRPSDNRQAGSRAPADSYDAGTLILLGTASTANVRQLEELARTGVPVHRLRPENLASWHPGSAGSVAVTVDAPVDPAHSPAILTALTELALRCHSGRHLVLSGGETARAVLDALDITELFPFAQAHPGAIVSRSRSGRLIATRPGSYGASDSLVNILATLTTISTI